ncbi:cobalt-precorrin-7 (C(5))-methyltransferase [Methanocella sp. CWC-04]|uniref:Cobalt-precorrin-7 (C(5))-methyltransferase n=1 Tax=Methanooceanicella nereidis TaxID=2052831 RepID=A0AAP2RD63_9EURY|nr:cobalt-precorrin-7 (C(5))-methyltransferase [Methanocella sp. CWC-04]MCD1295396.1 cobalt-precorrin-7 (C(5))-methyltransferase [Methanocella sp. CWC-04]
MKIVGVGCGPGMLTMAALCEIRCAKTIYGSGRAIELIKDYIPEYCDVHEIEDYGNLKEISDDSILLSTGDPMLAGLGSLNGEVVPGISSMQVAFARLKIRMTDSIIINAHGKDHVKAINDTIEELGRGRNVFLIADPGFNVKMIANSLIKYYPDVSISVCEELGYDTERITTGTPHSPPENRSDLFAIVIRK